MRQTGENSTVTRPVLRYHGGKWRLAPWVISYFPAHHTYVEPYGGAGSILMRKNRSRYEVLNDLDLEVFNVFTVLRDPEMSRELQRVLELTPYHRAEFELSYEGTEDPVERARRLIVRSAMAVGSDGGSRPCKNGFKAKSRKNLSDAVTWANYPEAVSSFCQRLRGVILENRPAIDVILHQDSPSTLFYIDPPYVPETRSSIRRGQRSYRHEMTNCDHVVLSMVLHIVKGPVVLSGYRCDLYDRLYASWLRVDRSVIVQNSPRTESLWLSPAAQLGLQGQLAL